MTHKDENLTSETKHSVCERRQPLAVEFRSFCVVLRMTAKKRSQLITADFFLGGGRIDRLKFIRKNAPALTLTECQIVQISE